jgi:adenine/guanine phosphoribosyltransferase-like PRPP-binding protein
MADKDIGYEEKLMIVKILKALNKFYSLRDLEQVLGVPFQNLWKYINLIGMPSNEVVENLMGRFSKLKIVDEVLSSESKKARSTPQNTALNIGFLELYAIKISRELRNRGVDIVLALSHDAIPFATLLSIEIDSDICIPVSNENLVTESVKPLTYFSHSLKRVEMLIYPRHCVKEGKKAFLTDIQLIDVDKMEAVVSMIRAREGKIEGLATVYIAKEVVARLSQFSIKIAHYLEVI